MKTYDCARIDNSYATGKNENALIVNERIKYTCKSTFGMLKIRERERDRRETDRKESDRRERKRERVREREMKDERKKRLNEWLIFKFFRSLVKI